MPDHATNRIGGLFSQTSPPFDGDDLTKHLGIAGKIALCVQSVSVHQMRRVLRNWRPGFAACFRVWFRTRHF
jgi:hypothetical protein